ncbi:two-partner secretion domain-containing protein [Methyloversatilis thermotolerans]|uniref:two-partner secretion domain-containing protein n=1 Tax=Methyloversatilis thermotolerans TaxID=1346290 RepID=UPI000399A961|nr:filamentous hemagglutinin N-terminal domain-containing protein [Methyloversatilis thermotolerans]
MKPTPLARALSLLCISGLPATVHALPDGATVTHGSATVNVNGGTMTITNTPNTIINWNGFSIDRNELVRIIQNNADSSILNRVTGGNPSVILGALQSNGKVFLINPNGILFGAGSRIDVGGLVASSLRMSDRDFLDGRARFTGEKDNLSKVSNAGTITTPTGGQVFLIAPNVDNTGVITAPDGQVILAAGHTVSVGTSSLPNVLVEVSADRDDLNVSELIASGRLFNITNSGSIHTLSNAQFTLKNGKVALESVATVTTTASSDISGNMVRGMAGTTGQYAGRFEAGAQGFIETSAKYLKIDRDIEISTQGGRWLLDPDNIEVHAGSASGVASSTVDVNTLKTALENGTDVEVSTTALGNSGGSEDGDIFWNAELQTNYNASGKLTVIADRDLLVNELIFTGNGKMLLTAERDIVIGSGVSSIGSASGDYDAIVIDAGRFFRADNSAFTFYDSVAGQSVANWQVYAQNPGTAGNNFGALQSNNVAVWGWGNNAAWDGNSGSDARFGNTGLNSFFIFRDNNQVVVNVASDSVTEGEAFVSGQNTPYILNNLQYAAADYAGSSSSDPNMPPDPYAPPGGGGGPGGGAPWQDQWPDVSGITIRTRTYTTSTPATDAQSPLSGELEADFSQATVSIAGYTLVQGSRGDLTVNAASGNPGGGDPGSGSGGGDSGGGSGGGDSGGGSSGGGSTDEPANTGGSGSTANVGGTTVNVPQETVTTALNQLTTIQVASGGTSATGGAAGLGGGLGGGGLGSGGLGGGLGGGLSTTSDSSAGATTPTTGSSVTTPLSSGAAPVAGITVTTATTMPSNVTVVTAGTSITLPSDTVTSTVTGLELTPAPSAEGVAGGGSGDGLIVGSTGSPPPPGDSGSGLIIGSTGNNAIVVSGGSDLVLGGGGGDLVLGGGGGDLVFGDSRHEIVTNRPSASDFGTDFKMPEPAKSTYEDQRANNPKVATVLDTIDRVSRGEATVAEVKATFIPVSDETSSILREYMFEKIVVTKAFLFETERTITIFESSLGSLLKNPGELGNKTLGEIYANDKSITSLPSGTANMTLNEAIAAYGTLQSKLGEAKAQVEQAETFSRNFQQNLKTAVEEYVRSL